MKSAVGYPKIEIGVGTEATNNRVSHAGGHDYARGPEEYIEFVTPDGTSSLRWNAFSSLYALKSCWVLVRHHEAYYWMIPTEALTAEATAFLKLKIREARVKLR
jgi:hypothetical protein